MPSYLTPGVYVEEIPSQSKPIEGVGTSIAAFVGLAPGGPVNKPVAITNWAHFERLFRDQEKPENGPFMTGAYLAHAVYGYFNNGGSMCYVVRAYPQDTPPPPTRTLPAVDEKRKRVPAFDVTVADGNEGEPVTVELIEVAPPPRQLTSGNGDGGKPADAKPADAKAADTKPADTKAASAKATDAAAADAKANGDDKPPKRYRLKVTVGDDEPLFYPTEKASPAGALREELTELVQQADNPPITLTPHEGAATSTALVPGAYDVWVEKQADDPKLNLGQVAGSIANRTGLAGLEAVDEITMVCIPDAMSPLTDEGARQDLQNQVIAGCENQGDRMAILDPPKATTSPEEMRAWRDQFDSKFATMYYPWIQVMDPLTDRPLKVPPCGHVAGLWARTDSTRGVHKAPANEVVLGANKLAFQVTPDEQGLMNRQGINCIRAFPGRGIRVWGARTISSDPEWRYVNVRRLFNYVSESIMEGTQWAVFEPNDSRLWTQLKISATNFLTRVWRDGALFGTTPDQAFYVKCDEETNPPYLVEAGQVTVEIGIAPVKPAEFVVFRISQFQVGAEAA
jgi:uncharacterized protein